MSADQPRVAVFSRCADSVEQGRRLENLSWRLWQREQLVESSNKAPAACSTSKLTPTTTLPQIVPSESRPQELPQLSGSVDSLADDEAVDFSSVSAPLEIRPRIQRLDSSASRRERHISSDDFEKMIVSIVKDKGPLSAPSQKSPLMAATKKEFNVSTVPALSRSGSTTTESQVSEGPSEDSHPSPLQPPVPSVARAPTFPEPAAAASCRDPLPEPHEFPAPKHVQPKKQPARFALGGSCSSCEQSQSVENLKVAPAALGKKPNKPIFLLGDSSGEDSVRSSIRSAAPAGPSTAVMNNLNDQALQHSESAVDSDTEAEYVDESAIDDDDDSSDWEDSVEDSGKSSVDDKFFQRVESKANLASRPSLITLMLAQSDNLGNQASQSTPAIHRTRTTPNGLPGAFMGASPNDSDESPLMMKGMRHSALKPISEIPRSTAQPIVTHTSHHQAALSPRTTRRNMLATELTESLRRHLLWERQQKTLTAKASLKRRHTSHDVANLKQFPDKVCMKPTEDVEARSWNQFFSKEALNGYHSKGW